MSTPTPTDPWKRVLPLTQVVLVRSYKFIGLAALAGILLGLIFFLAVNGFYLFDNTWIRPVVLSPSHERVREVNRDLQEALTQRNSLDNEKAQLVAELTSIANRIEADTQFEADYEAVAAHGAAAPGDLASLLARREVDRARLDRLESADRRVTVGNHIKQVEDGIARYDRLIEQFKSSPYVEAIDREVTVAFVPYDNLENVRPGVAIYGCKLRLVWCSRVGEVVSVLEGEVTNTHPQDGSSERGLLMEIELSEKWAAKEAALFAGSKPFWLF